jgi:hypothetical protein
MGENALFCVPFTNFPKLLQINKNSSLYIIIIINNNIKKYIYTQFQDY